MVGASLLAWSPLAHAQDTEVVEETAEEYLYEEPEGPDLYSVYGASLSLGGGLVGFFDGDTRDVTSSVGGAWDLRLVFGTRTDVAVEAAYTGGAYGLDALGLDEDAVLLSTGLEVLGRVNFLQDQWQPYALLGIGWRHYSVVNDDFNTSSVNNDDDLGEFPLGAGVSYRDNGFIVDLRGMFRASFNDDLIETRVDGEDANLHNWQAQVTVGLEF